MSHYLKVNNGRIEIHPDVGYFDTEPIFATDSAYEAARYLYDYGIFEWTNSSSMDFADEDGWHCKNACDEIVEYMTSIHAHQIRRNRS